MVRLPPPPSPYEQDKKRKGIDHYLNIHNTLFSNSGHFQDITAQLFLNLLEYFLLLWRELWTGQNITLIGDNQQWLVVKQGLDVVKQSLLLPKINKIY